MKHLWRTLAGILAMAARLSVGAQEDVELVYNGSFERHTSCPQRIDALGVMREVEAWWQPTGGSSDYFHPCGGRECGVPRNKLGSQAAHSGEAYCGIYCSQAEYREYLQTELRQSLTAGRRYRVRFYVSLAEKSPHSVATLGALLTPYRASDTGHGVLMQREVTLLSDGFQQSIAVPYEPQVMHSAAKALDNTRGWTEVSGEFVAAGGERFLTIGNFMPFNASSVASTGVENAVLPGAYYYVDDVSVVCIDTVVTQPLQSAPEAPRTGEVKTLHEVYFASGSSELLPQSHNELLKLVETLQQHPSMHIEVRGHTDDQGTIEYNQALSEARAKAVVDFLSGKGIAPERLAWHGYGKTMPVASNATPEGRQLNRRVEYIVK